MRSRARDVVALLLLIAVLVPYAGYLVDGEMPLIENAQAMASTGLLLGGLAFWVLRSPPGPQRIGKVEAGSAALGLALYILTIALAATSAAEFLLAGFIGSLLLVFIADLLEPKTRR